MKRYRFERSKNGKTLKKETSCKFEIPMSTLQLQVVGSLSISLGKIRQRAACSITWRCDSSESRPSATIKCLPTQQVKEITDDHDQNRKSFLLIHENGMSSGLVSTLSSCTILQDMLDSYATSSAPLPQS